MNKKKNHIYFIKDNHFIQYSKYGLFYSPRTNIKKDRPHFLCLKEDKLCWVIPLSSQVEKYKKEYQKEVSKYGKSVKFHFAKVFGKENVLLIQNAFPVASYNIKGEFKRNGKVAKLDNDLDINEITKKLNIVLTGFKNGTIFFNNQPDVISLEKEIRQDIKDKDYLNSLRDENSNLKNPFQLNDGILKSMLEYSKSSGEYKTLKQIAKEYIADKMNSKKNPILQSIGVYFQTQQENTKELLPKEIDTKKEIAPTKNYELER